MLLDTLTQTLRNVPRSGIPGEVDLPPIMVSLDQKLHHTDHLSRILLCAVEVSDLIAGKLKSRGHDHAAAGFPPLWDDALLARRTKRTAGLHLHGERPELVDGEESLVRAKFRQDRANVIELF